MVLSMKARDPGHLWSRIVWASAGGLQEVAISHDIAQAKIGNLDRHVPIKEEILRR